MNNQPINLYQVAMRVATSKRLSGNTFDKFVMDYQFTHCSKCGSEIDSQGWCANYCTNED